MKYVSKAFDKHVIIRVFTERAVKKQQEKAVETSQHCFTEQTSETSASRLGRFSRAEAALGANSE